MELDFDNSNRDLTINYISLFVVCLLVANTLCLFVLCIMDDSKQHNIMHNL